MRPFCSATGSAFALLCTLLVGAAARVQQQVNVDLGKVINPLTPFTMGVYTQVGDGDLLSAQTLGALRAAGIDTVTYPTGWDSVANVYHWSTNKMTPKPGNANDPKNPYIDGRNNFGQLALALEKYGLSAIIHVNYGSNAAGSGGGVPQEAAAWVAYCNALPTDSHALGIDASGQDWKTSGYWATLRASEPLASDDGYNFLRIHHPAPLHMTLWQIGEDEAENGFYGGDHKGTIDLHVPYPAASADNERRRKEKDLSPSFYGEQAAIFSTAMKAVDPNIQVGATLTTPTIDTWATDWNLSVLKAACKDIDFVTYTWHPGTTLPPGWHTLDDQSVLGAPAAQLPQIFSESLYEARKSCPSGKIPRVVLGEFSPISWAAMKTPIVASLFAAESYSALAMSGISNASWFQLREGGLFGKDGKPTPAFFGAQMVHIIAYRPGDAFVTVSGAKSPVVAIATRRRDGVAGVLLTNHDAAQAQQVRINVTGADLAGTGMKYEYSSVELAKGAGPERSPVQTEGNSITLTVPPYGIVALQLGLKK
jgi:hypothetical protein